MLAIRNIIAQVDDGIRRDRDISLITRVIVHKIDFSKDDGGGGYWRGVKPIARENLDGYGVAARFKDARKVPDKDRRTAAGVTFDWRDRPGAFTGGQNPYTFLIRTDGTIEQMLAISDYGPHARRWSWTGIGIAMAGDFERDMPTRHQSDSLLGLTTGLVSWIGLAPSKCVVGHTELEGAYSDPNKRCPGVNLSMDGLRWELEGVVKLPTSKQAEALALERMGITF